MEHFGVRTAYPLFCPGPLAEQRFQPRFLHILLHVPMRKVGRPWKDDDPDIRPNRVLYVRDDIVAICDRYLVSRAPQLSSLRVKEEGASGQSYTGSAEGPAVCASETDANSELSSSGDSHDYWSDDTGSHNSTSILYSDYQGFSSFDDGWSNSACNLVRRPNWKERIARATKQSVIKQLCPDSNMDPEATLLQQFFSLPIIVERGARNVGTRPGGFERLNPPV